MKRLRLVVTIVFCLSGYANAGIRGKAMDPRKYVGDVSGWVIDSETGKPVEGTKVSLMRSQVQGESSKGIGRTQALTLPFKPDRITDVQGRFLINFVPTPDSGQSYSLVVSAKGYQTQIINNLFVPPGAVMSPELTIRLSPGNAPLRVLSKSEMESRSSFQ